MNRSPYNSTSNRSPSNSLPLRKAIIGFLNFKTAAGLSQRSVASYQRILEQWADYAGDKKVSQFSDHDINAYLVYMRTAYVPRRFGGDTRALSPKSLRNIWISLCAFFTWAHTEFKMENPMKSVPAPKFKAPDIEPFTQEEIERMLKACTYSREAETFIRRKFAMRRPTANRDQAIIFTLLDSGMRASEFSSLRVGDFDAKRGQLDIRHGEEGGAKGGKGRVVYLGKTARHALWRYLAEREDGEDPNAPLFVVRRNRGFNPDALRHLIKSIAAKAGVRKAYPHRFRHTFVPIEVFDGDILTAGTLHRAIKGCDLVFHTAAVFAYWGVSADDLETTAVQATLNVLEACKAAHIPRVVLTASSVVFGSSNRPVLRDETFELHERDVPPYILAKQKQEKAAFRCAAELGLELVAVCPTIVVGPYDVHLSPSNSIILTYLSDPSKLTFPGGCNIVSARDVARGHILAARLGKNGERYLLGSENLEWSAIHRTISELCGIPGPFYSANHTSSYLAATAAELTAWFTGGRPLTTRTQATMVGRYYWYRHDRMSALGFSPQPARLALAEAIGWLVASKHVSQNLRATLQLSREVYAARNHRFESERKDKNSS